MRLWSLHPSYLDQKGLVALWREGLLAQHVLAGKTKGYRRHPQLKRFQQTQAPMEAISIYLRYVYEEACRRGFKFSKERIFNWPAKKDMRLSVTKGQIDYEMEHLKKKCHTRDREKFMELKKVKRVRVHPMLRAIKGPVADWEKI